MDEAVLSNIDGKKQVDGIYQMWIFPFSSLLVFDGIILQLQLSYGVLVTANSSTIMLCVMFTKKLCLFQQSRGDFSFVFDAAEKSDRAQRIRELLSRMFDNAWPADESDTDTIFQHILTWQSFTRFLGLFCKCDTFNPSVFVCFVDGRGTANNHVRLICCVMN